MLNTQARQTPPPKRLALYAAIASLVALLAYLVLPFISITLTAAANSSYGSSPSYVQSFQVGAGVIELFTGFICIEALLAVAALCVAGLFALRDAPFGQGTMPVVVQRRRSAYAILILGAAAVIYQFLLVTIGTSQINTAIQNALASSTSSLSLASLLRGAAFSMTLGYGVGSWIYLLAMLGVIGCGWMILNAEKVPAALQPAQAQDSSTPWQQPVQPSQPSWQQPSHVYVPPSHQTGQFYPPSQPNTGPQPNPSYTPPPYPQQWQQPLPPSNPGEWRSPTN